MRTVVARDSPLSPGLSRVEALRVNRMGSGVGQGDGGGDGDGDGGGGWAHAPRVASALAKTADIKEVLFMVRKPAACQHHVSYATATEARPRSPSSRSPAAVKVSARLAKWNRM